MARVRGGEVLTTKPFFTTDGDQRLSSLLWWPAGHIAWTILNLRRTANSVAPARIRVHELTSERGAALLVSAEAFPIDLGATAKSLGTSDTAAKFSGAWPEVRDQITDTFRELDDFAFSLKLEIDQIIA